MIFLGFDFGLLVFIEISYVIFNFSLGSDIGIYGGIIMLLEENCFFLVQYLCIQLIDVVVLYEVCLKW